MSLKSDRYTKSELFEEFGTFVPSWAAEVGRRLEFIATKIGKDKSVQITERSWKQLQRYFEGGEVPASVVQNLATAAGATADYVLDGNIITCGDAEIERILLDNKIELIRNNKRQSDFGETERILLDRSQELAKIMAVLIGRPKRTTRLCDYLEPDSNLSIDPEVKAELIKEMVTPKPLPVSVPPASIDRDLLAQVHKGVAEVYRSENARIGADPLADEVARIYDGLVATASLDSPEKRQIALDFALHQLRVSLRTPVAGGSRKQVS